MFWDIKKNPEIRFSFSTQSLRFLTENQSCVKGNQQAHKSMHHFNCTKKHMMQDFFYNIQDHEIRLSQTTENAKIKLISNFQKISLPK